MKKILLSAALLVGMTVAANAQNAGEWWIGGNVGVWAEDPDGGSSTTSYKILPEVGWAWSDEWAVGLKIGYAHDEGSYGFSEELNATEADVFMVNPFVRWSFWKGNVGSMFVDGGVTYANIDPKDQKKTDYFEVGLRPGVSLNLSPRIALTGQFGFLGWKMYDGAEKTNHYGLDLDMDQFMLGVNIRF